MRILPFAAVFCLSLNPALSQSPIDTIDGPIDLRESTRASPFDPSCNSDPNRGSLQTYNFSFKTGNIARAATDSHILVEIQGACRFFAFTISGEQGQLNRNTTTVVSVTSRYAGPIRQIRMFNSLQGERGGGWYSEFVEIDELTPSTRSYCAPINQWLTKSGPNGLSTPWMEVAENANC